MKKFCFTIITLIFTTIAALAQSSDVAMADQMRSDGKIYVVVAVVGILFLGMLIYLIVLNRKISKMEKLVGEKRD